MVARYDRPGHYHDAAYDVCVDSEGNVIVMVTSAPTTNISNLDYTPVKYDTEGNDFWVTHYGVSWRNIASAVAMDSKGNVYVGGISTGIRPLPPAGTIPRLQDYTSIKYSQIISLPDLIIESLMHSPESLITSNTITFTAVVKNIGNTPLGFSTLNFKVGGETSGKNFTIQGFDPGASLTVLHEESLRVGKNYKNSVTTDVNKVDSTPFQSSSVY